MITYINNLFIEFNNFVYNSTSLYEDTITINKNLSLILYNNEEHIGKKINPFILRDHFEPDFSKLFKSNI